MVAARAANQTPDLRLAFGSLLLAPREIEHPRWRLDAYARIAPALHRRGVPLDRLRGVLREGMRAAVCPAPLRVGLEQLVLDHLEHGRIAALALGALWTRDWPSAALYAAAAYVAARDWRTAGRLAEGRGKSHALTLLARDGCLDGELVGDVRDAELYEASVPLVAALVEARDPQAEMIATRVKEREPAQAHVARLRGDARGLATPRGRSGARLWIARDLLAAERLDDARAIGEQIEMPMVRQYARLELARALVERGRISDGLVELRQVVDPRLAIERRAMFDEIRMVCSHPETPLRGEDLRGPTWQPIAWMLPRRALDAATRVGVRLAGYFLRHGTRLDDHNLLDSAAYYLRELVDHPGGRRAVLGWCERLGIDVELGLLNAQRMRGGLDALISEHVAMRAERIATSPPALVPPSNDPASLDRALYDEHVALSQPARRRVLIAVSQHSLRAALVDPARWPRDVVATRLRTLVHLGGSLARDAIVKALRTLPFAPALVSDAIEALARLDARTAAELALERVQRLERVFHVLYVVELHGGLPRGLTCALAKLETRFVSREWILELVAVWRAHTGSVPSLDVLRRLAMMRGTKPEPVGELVARIQHAPAVLRASDDHVAIAEQLAERPALLEDLAMCDPSRVDVAMRPWCGYLMRDLVKRATSKVVGTIVPRIVEKVARRLHPATLEPVQPFQVSGVRYRVRLLDKRLDLLTYLRFADVPARSCYRSGQWYYYRSTRDNLLAAWKDPLTLCFHVERETSEVYRPCGFLFGSFADVGGKLALLFNSLHVRPGSAAVREQVLRAVERTVAPFGVKELAIANVHGGRGVLPADYVSRGPVEVVRYRALAVRDSLIALPDDDLDLYTNQRDFADHLYWRALQQPDTPSPRRDQLVAR